MKIFSKRKNNTTIKIEDSTVTNSNIGCTINQINLLDVNIRTIFDDIWTEINEILDDHVKSKFIRKYLLLKEYYETESTHFHKLLIKLSCNFSKDPTSSQIQNIIKFWLIVMYYDESNNIPTIIENEGMLECLGNTVCVLSPARSTTMSIEKSIAALTEYFKVIGPTEITNALCYISKITHTKEFCCLKCKDGFIDIDSTGIVEDFVNGRAKQDDLKKKHLQEDFMNIKVERNLLMKCGNCVSDFERMDDNYLKLKMEILIND